jgi:peptide chain release factor 1
MAHLRHEAGVHRVQAVPATEASGRVQMSAATVAVLPEAGEVDIDINESDLGIDRPPRQRRRRPARQQDRERGAHHAHADGRRRGYAGRKSQHANKAKAMKILKARILDAERERQENERRRRPQGRRSARATAPNASAPTISRRGRCTDHRINLTVHEHRAGPQGDLDALIDALFDADLRRRAEAVTQR